MKPTKTQDRYVWVKSIGKGWMLKLSLFGELSLLIGVVLAAIGGMAGWKSLVDVGLITIAISMLEVFLYGFLFF